MTDTIKLLTATASSLLLSACLSTQYVSYGENEPSTVSLTRTVEVEITNEFYEDQIDCVTVLPASAESDEHPAKQLAVEDAVARHLKMKITEVIDRRDRNALTRQLALDLAHPDDRNRYATMTKCSHFALIRPWGGDDHYLVFWSRKALGVEVTITDAVGNATLWKARHVAQRSNGGLPLSPVGAVMSLFEASTFTADNDISLSLADDVARRIVQTLPDMRETRFSALLH